MNQETGKYDVPGLYDISGSANFYNKSDIGLSMYKEENYQNTLYIQKVKFKFWGEIGSVSYNWDKANGRYTEYGADPTNWLKDKQTVELIDYSEPNNLDSDEVPF